MATEADSGGYGSGSGDRGPGSAPQPDSSRDRPAPAPPQALACPHCLLNSLCLDSGIHTPIVLSILLH